MYLTNVKPVSLKVCCFPKVRSIKPACVYVHTLLNTYCGEIVLSDTAAPGESMQCGGLLLKLLSVHETVGTASFSEIMRGKYSRSSINRASL